MACMLEDGSPRREEDVAAVHARHSRALFRFVACVWCVLVGVLITGCSTADKVEEGADSEDVSGEEDLAGADESNSTRAWSVLGNIGVAETIENVGSIQSRQWIIQCPDMWTERLKSFGEGSPGEIKWKGDGANGVSAIIYQGTTSELETLLEQNTGVLFVEEVISVQASGLRGAERRLAEQTFTDNRLWGLDRIDDEVGLDRSYDNSGITGQGVHVYVLDTGIRTTHSEFEVGRAVPDVDLTVFPAQRCNGNRNCASDRNGHGTHCAGTIAGKTVGVAKRAIVHAVKVLGDDGSGSNAGIIRGINFVAVEGLRPAVISMSLGCGSPCQSRSEAVAIEGANRAGVTVVVAAGNNGRTAQPDACAYAPANIPQAITVGSITINNDQRSSFSNIGSCIDIFAPGSDIFSASSRSDSAAAILSGTSMACPHVSGVAALLLSAEPAMNPEEVERRIVGAAHMSKVQDSRGSPNRLLFMGSLAVTPTPAPTPLPPTPSPLVGTPAPSPSTSAPVSGQRFTLLGEGFCRTASGARGTFTVTRQTTLADCQEACVAQATCVG